MLAHPGVVNPSRLYMLSCLQLGNDVIYTLAQPSKFYMLSYLQWCHIYASPPRSGDPFNIIYAVMSATGKWCHIYDSLTIKFIYAVISATRKWDHICCLENPHNFSFFLIHTKQLWYIQISGFHKCVLLDLKG